MTQTFSPPIIPTVQQGSRSANPVEGRQRLLFNKPRPRFSFREEVFRQQKDNTALLTDLEVTAIIALGSNLGDRRRHLTEALIRIACEPSTRLFKLAAFYETPPQIVVDQPMFLNSVIMVKTHLKPQILLQRLLKIESAMGRDRSESAIEKGPRIIDLDLIFYDDLVLEQEALEVNNSEILPRLILPHPEAHKRDFVLVPLRQIAPNWLHPHLKTTVTNLVASLPQVELKVVPEGQKLPKFRSIKVPSSKRSKYPTLVSQ